MTHKEKFKFKRNRLNSTHRWSEAETRDLLEAVVDQVKENPESFEKPTAQIFYNKISVKAISLKEFNWISMKSKVRYLKSRFIAANTWKGQTGAGLLANGEEKSISEYIAKLCPYYNILEQIFGQRKSVNPNVVFETTRDDTNFISSDEEDVDGDLLRDPPLYEVIYESSVSVPEFQTQNDETQASTSSLLNNTETSFETFKKNLIAQKPKKKNNCNSSSISLLATIQEKKVNFEISKWEQQLELETKQFELSKERTKNEVELSKLKLDKEIEMKKLDIEKDERLAMAKMKLEAESLERIKKFELQLKLNGSQNDCL